MDLTHLRYFQTIAESGSMTAAARVLRVSQPTLTVAVRNLEERLGTQLLLRHRSGVSLTSTGRELLDHAREVFTVLQRAEQRITGLESDEIGRFVIGCHESLGSYFLPEFMIGFLREAPRIELALWNGTSAGVQEAVIARQIDYGLVVNAIPHPELVLVDLFHDAVALFYPSRPMPADDAEALAAARAILRAGPLILAGRVQQSQQMIDRLAADGALPSRHLSCGDLELVKSLTAAGVGVGILPERVAAYGVPGRLARLHPALPSIPDTIHLAYRADSHLTRASLRLKEALQAHGRRLDGR